MDWRFSYPSQRMPVLARSVVATSQPLATQAGLQALQDGGTAADAAICSAITLTVVEPVANGIGSDAFALVWNGGLSGLNASGRSPMGQARAAFDGMDAMPRTGWPAVTVPGCVSAWVALHARAGRLPFERLFEPAIRYATEGYPVSPMTAASWRRSVDRYKAFPAWMATFAPHGRGPAVGEVVRLPDHARTLASIAASKGESFYRGEIAARIEAAARADGGAMRAADLSAHQPAWVEPWSMDYRDVTLHEIPPNGQGLAALIALGILGRFDAKGMDPDGADWTHLQIEAMKAAFADAHAFVADPDLGVGNARALLDPAYLATRAASIRMDRASAWQPRQLPASSTVYLCAADSEGHLVSYIQSNYEGFGSGVVVPGTGIALQNRGAGFSLAAGHPNEYAPGKRPYHTIIPGFLSRNGAPVAAFGVMGGAMQPQGHVQVVTRLTDQGLNPQSALDAPRWQVLENGDVALEPGFPPTTIDSLRARGHSLTVAPDASVFFGGGQMAFRSGESYIAASDPRRDGMAAGF
ncbi:MAG: gamma-glutamyltransferase family protein [Phycisphaerae bacterium]|nr:gamma-glutamyltransferase family protein [Phycisphaerae bacterium]